MGALSQICLPHYGPTSRSYAISTQGTDYGGVSEAAEALAQAECHNCQRGQVTGNRCAGGGGEGVGDDACSPAGARGGDDWYGTGGTGGFSLFAHGHWRDARAGYAGGGPVATHMLMLRLAGLPGSPSLPSPVTHRLVYVPASRATTGAKFSTCPS